MLPVLSSTWEIVPAGTELLLWPVTLPEEGVAVHVNRVPGTPDVSVMFVFRLSHWLCIIGVVVLVGVG